MFRFKGRSPGLRFVVYLPIRFSEQWFAVNNKHSFSRTKLTVAGTAQDYKRSIVRLKVFT
jgi:hypothetical protein